jgi:hypothetical protein
VRARIAVSVVLAAGVLLGTSGCTFFTTQSTLQRYDPSDGVGTQVGTVKVRNALLLSADGETASFLVNFINDGQDAVDLRVQYASPSGKVTSTFHLEAGEVKTFGSKTTTQLVFKNIGKEAGTLLPVYFQYGSVSGQQLLVPILDGSQSDYSGLLPTNSPTPSPTSTSTNPPVTVPIPTAAP